jgi:hypothetical protein
MVKLALYQVSGLEGVWGNRGITLHILTPSIRCNLVVSFIPRPLKLRYRLDRKLNGSKDRSGCCGEENIYSHWEMNLESSFVQLVT